MRCEATTTKRTRCSYVATADGLCTQHRRHRYLARVRERIAYLESQILDVAGRIEEDFPMGPPRHQPLPEEVTMLLATMRVHVRALRVQRALVEKLATGMDPDAPCAPGNDQLLASHA